jgi:hypothetical protein
MKLGEALVLRKDLQTRIEQLRARLKDAVLVQEGEKPPEDPQKLLGQVMEAADALADLIAKINRTNMTTRLPAGGTLTEALARRDVLTVKQVTLRQVAGAVAERPQRYGLAEIRTLVTVDVAALRAQADELARERRELDTAIQATNWQVELLD